MAIPIPYVHLGVGFASVVLSIPLIMRKVPMNHVYGFRLRKAFVSRHNWYELNAYGGKALLAYGVFLLAFGYLAEDLAPAPTSPWAPVFLAGPLLAVVPAMVLVNNFARRLPDKEQ